MVVEVDGICLWSVACSETATNTSTLFPVFVYGSPRVYWMQKISASFFLSFYGRFMLGNPTSPESWMKCRTRHRCAPKVIILSLFHIRNTLLKLQVARASSLALRAVCAGGTRCPQRVGNAASRFCDRLAAASRSTNALAFALFFSANGFECAVLRWSVSDERGEVHLAGDQIRSFKFSFARQRSGVAPDVTEKKFHWA